MSTAASLIEQASAVLDESTPHGNRAACWIARAALENVVDDLLLAKNCSAHEATMRSKLTVLQVACREEGDVPLRAEYAWSRLSQACHHHAFELSPTASEVHTLIRLVGELANCRVRTAD